MSSRALSMHFAPAQGRSASNAKRPCAIASRISGSALVIADGGYLISLNGISNEERSRQSRARNERVPIITSLESVGCAHTFRPLLSTASFPIHLRRLDLHDPRLVICNRRTAGTVRSLRASFRCLYDGGTDHARPRKSLVRARFWSTGAANCANCLSTRISTLEMAQLFSQKCDQRVHQEKFVHPEKKFFL